MSKFKIPQAFIQGFKELATIDDALIAKITSFLQGMSLGMGPTAFMNKLKEEDSSIGRELANVVYSFGALLNRNANANLNEMARDLSQACKEADLPNVEDLENRLIKIFQASRNLKLTSKAIELLKENDNVYIDSRVLSDIRMVFDDNLNHDDRCAMVMHNLKLTYQTSNEEKEFYISLDHADLIKLKQTIERAIEKDDILRNTVTKDITFININE